MRQSPDRDTDVKTPGARELWSGQAKTAQPWTNKVRKEQKKVHKEEKHRNYGPARQKKVHLSLGPIRYTTKLFSPETIKI